MGFTIPVCLSADDPYFSWAYRSWLIRTLLEASFGILSNRYLAVPNGVGLLQSTGMDFSLPYYECVITNSSNSCSLNRLSGNPYLAKCEIFKMKTPSLHYAVSSERRGWGAMSYLDVGGVEWKASETLLLSFRNSSEAWSAAIAIPWDFSVFPSSRIKPWK